MTIREKLELKERNKKIKDLYKAGKTTYYIAEVFGLSQSRVFQIVNPYESKKTLLEICCLLMENKKTPQEIANRVNCSLKIVLNNRNIIRDLGYLP